MDSLHVENSISRRTRSNWDAFYKTCHDQIKKKPTNQSSVEKNVGDDSISIEDSNDSDDNGDDCDEDYKLKNVRKIRRRAVKRKAVKSGEVDLINMLVDSIWKGKKLFREKTAFVNYKANVPSQGTLPLKFRFGDDDQKPEKTDSEMEIDSLFLDLEMGLWESEIGSTNSSMTDDECTISGDMDESRAACCRRGQHDVVLDEQIGIVCKYCSAVLLEIKHVLPPFHVETPERHAKGQESEELKNSLMDRIDQFEDSTNGSLESSIHSQGTVLDLIPDADQKELYPHQLEGLEFLWRNIAGDIQIKNIKNLPAERGRGCIISHAPGTGKTRLTIVFLQTFMKLYPNSHPIIIAPRGMLLTWEQEFAKWKVDIKFHNLNETKLSNEETSIATTLIDEAQAHNKNKDYIRFVKLLSWMKGGSVLGIGYRLFEELAGEHNKNCNKFKKLLLELPGLLVLDEGHTPRNNQSLMWKVLTKTTTQRRVILSGTPFQNNFTELYNTLCLVNPKFSQQITGKQKMNNEWAHLTNCDEGLKKLRSVIEPFVHIHKGGILEKTLPGIRDCLVILKPTDLQNELLHKNAQVTPIFLEQTYLDSLISVHPSLVCDRPEFFDHKKTLKSLESNTNAGVKTRFLVKLIELSSRFHEKVLVFSEYIDPLIHIKNMIKRHFCWKEGKEVIYMDGELGMKQRQVMINLFNDKNSEARVLLASQRACSEGINLIGASRVVLLDVAWNPSVERQAICRAYRLGQEKMVYVYHLVTSMEDKKYAKQAEKERVSELIFSGGGGKTPPCREVVWEDRVLEAMVGDCGMFEKIIYQQKGFAFG